MYDDLDVNELFKIVVDNGGSDLHLRYDLVPKMRKDGVLVALPGFEDKVFDSETVSNLVFRTMEPIYDSTVKRSKENTDENTYGKFVQNRYGLNYAYEAFYNGKAFGRWRISVYLSRKQEGMVARLLQDEPLTFETLNAHPTIPQILNNQDGIIFVTGATGSGKSTLMGAMVDQINSTLPVNIISLEDPIEMIHEPKVATVIQRDVGLGIDETSYESALQNALRQDPDVILIGEIRNVETMRAAFEAANTGHLVITTLHTSSAAETVNRVLKLYPYDEREGVAFDLAAALRGIVSQRLLPHKSGKGRVAVNEILVNTSKVRKVIAEESGNAEKLYDLIETGEAGSITFEQFMLGKINEDVLDFDVAYRASSRKEFFDAVREGRDPLSDRRSAEPNISSSANISDDNNSEAEEPLPLPAPEPFVEEEALEDDDPASGGNEVSDIGEPVSRYGVFYHKSDSSGPEILGDQFQEFMKNRKQAPEVRKKALPIKPALDLNLTKQESLVASFPKRETKTKE